MYNLNFNIDQYQNVVLQFPPEEINEGLKTIQLLRNQYPQKKFYLLSDHLFSKCCVDKVGASHINYDIIIHFGIACFSEQIDKVIYVLPNHPYNQEIFDALKDKQEYLIFIEQPYDLQLYEQLSLNYDLIISQVHNIPADYNYVGMGYYAKQMKDKIIFIGKQNSILLERFILQFNLNFFKQILILDPVTAQFSDFIIQTQEITKQCKQVEDAQKANTFGLLINNPNAEYTKKILNQCKQLLKCNNIKYYTFSMNNLNEAKLGNFPEIDAYVIIACYNNIILETKKFYKLIITPFQLQQAFGNTLFQIQSDLRQYQNFEKAQIHKQEEQLETESRLQKIQSQLVHNQQIFGSLEFYKNRIYQGLEIKQNESPAVLKQGLSGIASQYKNEQEK